MNTIEQDAIHNAFRGRSNIIVEAGAGTGKTTTLVEGNHLLPHSTLFLAFNKSIADELSRRMPRRTCKTFHAIGLANLSSRVGRLPVDAYKYQNLAKKEGLSKQDAQYVDELITLFQLEVSGIFTEYQSWDDFFFADTVGEEGTLIEIEGASLDYNDAIKWARYILAKELQAPTGYTFGDMLWMLAYFAHHKRWYLRDYDCVVVDELQDVSPIRLHLLGLFGKRMIGVGDRRQAIYAFAGAMTGAMTAFEETFKCETLPLSVTWRCDLAIIQEAETVVGKFLQPRPNAGEGEIKYAKISSLLHSNIDNESLIVCRTNSPLLAVALKLLSQGKPFQLMSDYPERLAKIARKLAKTVTGMSAFKTLVDEYYKEKLESIKSKGLISRLLDERDCIYVIADTVKNPDDVADKFKELMNSKFGPKLCTGHKSKGLEANHVFFLRPDLSPAPWVDPADEEAYQQELNLRYVMITRAKHTLTYLEDEDGKTK